MNRAYKLKLKRRLYKRQFMRGAGHIHCEYCGKPLTPMTATIDHVFPKSAGGTYRLANLVLACQECNSRKGSMPASKFREIIKQQGRSQRHGRHARATA